MRVDVENGVVINAWTQAELFRGFERSARVGVQRFRVTDNFEFDQIGLEQLSREMGGKHGIFCGVATGGIGKNPQRRAIEEIQHRFAAGIVEVDPANRNRDHLRAASFMRGLHDVHGGILPGPDDQARREGARVHARIGA